MLVDYQRPERRFLVADENVTRSSGQWLVRDGAGRELKPEDYLAAFSRFVRDNPEHIDAISILLDRPHDWSPSR